MNLAHFKKNVGQRVQLVPPAFRLDQFGRTLAQIDDLWIVEAVVEDGIEVSNPRTGHNTLLGKDHIHHYTTNPDLTRSTGIKHGFLTLLVQIYLQGQSLMVRPTYRPGEPVAPPPPKIVEKLVGIQYPENSGLLAKLQSEGFKVSWCLEPKLQQRVELEGWEVVTEEDSGGCYVTYRLRDRPADQILIKKR